MNVSLGKAGRKRWMGRKPHNRGTSMNPVSHPMGGGEGTNGGRPASVQSDGRARQGRQDAQEKEAVERLDHSPPSAWSALRREITTPGNPAGGKSFAATGQMRLHYYNFRFLLRGLS